MHAFFFCCCALLGYHEAIKPYSTNQLTTILQSTNQPKPLIWGEEASKNTFVLSPHT